VKSAPNGSSYLQQLLLSLRPVRLPLRDYAERSAVAAIIRDGQLGKEILFIERARRKGDPWSGQIAFPGGRKQAGDTNTCDTAIRETQEELGLNLNAQGRFVARLPDVITRRHNRLLPMVVTPYLFELTETVQTDPNQEVASSLWVPLAYLTDPQQRRQFVWQAGVLKIKLPCIEYRHYRIWGLTLVMLGDVLRLLRT
jgi:8-oxo-dGTP pyrophosphatase MutT (NUDIX family)